MNNKNYKQILGIVLVGVSLVGCSNPDNSNNVVKNTTEATGTNEASKSNKKEKIELIMVTNASEGLFEETEAIVRKFEEEYPYIKVDFTTQGKDYEQLMKAKMASNEMPDVFATHGWSVNRYKEYLRPLNDQTWAENVVDTLKPIVTDSENNMYVLPLNLDQSGLCYNRGMLEELNLEVPRTWEEFFEACEIIKQAGKIPVYIAGKDTRGIANMLDISATTVLVSDPNNNHADALVDGSFDWDNWNQVNNLLLKLKDNGYLNKDCVTADPIGISEKMGNGEVAFMFQNNRTIIEALKLYPEAKLGMMPVPTVSKEDEPVLIGGEREAYGIWKESKYQEEALLLLEFMARPENIKSIAEETGMPAGLKGIEVDLGELTAYYNQYSDLRTFPYFDRVYLPNGMWSTLRTIGGGLIAGDIKGNEATAIMKEDYEKLRTQN